MIMKSSMVLASSWLTSDPRRAKLVVAGVAVLMMLIGLGAGEAFAGPATGGVHGGG